MWWENILDVCAYKIDIFFAIALISSTVHTRILSKCKFRRHFSVGSGTILIESLKFRSNSRIAGLPVIYCKNCKYEFFEYFALLLFLFRSDTAKHGL